MHFRRMAMTAIAVAVAGTAFTSSAYATAKFNFSAKTWKLERKFKRQEVDYYSSEKPGTIVISTRKKFLFYILGNNRAIRYGIGVGRWGFRWNGTEKITRKAAWPDWRPPAEMLQREPDLPKIMPGGPDNPLGARALYLGHTLYRIHGTAQPWTIGTAVSSGCIRLTNENIIDLYKRASVGAKVVVE